MLGRRAVDAIVRCGTPAVEGMVQRVPMAQLVRQHPPQVVRLYPAGVDSVYTTQPSMVMVIPGGDANWLGRCQWGGAKGGGGGDGPTTPPE